jgi:hypothetical protein
VSWDPSQSPHFPAIVVREFLTHGDDSIVKKMAFESIEQLFACSLDQLPEHSSTTLISIREAIHGSINAQQSLSSAKAFASVLREQIGRGGDACMRALEASVPDHLESSMRMTRAVDHLGHLAATQTEMADDMQRSVLASTYRQLLEGVWRTLTHILIQISDIAAGKREAYEPLSQKVTLRAIHDQLAARSDTRYRNALLGFNLALRNAEAHADIGFVGDVIEMRSGNHSSGVATEKLSDEELLDTLADLTLTCQTLDIALQVMQLEHRVDVFSIVEGSLERYVSLLRPTVEIFLRLADLAVVSLRCSDSALEIRAAPVGETNAASPDAYLEAVAGLVGVLPPVREFRLQIEQRKVVEWAVIVDADAAREYTTTPELCSDVMEAVYHSRCQFVATPPGTERRDGYIAGFLKPLLRTLMQDLVELMEALETARAAESPMEVSFTSARANCYRTALRMVPPVQADDRHAQLRFENVVVDLERSARGIRRDIRRNGSVPQESRDLVQMLGAATSLSEYISSITH